MLDAVLETGTVVCWECGQSANGARRELEAWARSHAGETGSKRFDMVLRYMLKEVNKNGS